MQAFQSLVQEVEAAIATGGGARRADTLRQLTTLFLQQAPLLADGHVDVFDEVIGRLASEIEFRARVELSERLADITNAPRRTVASLARDERIDVAGPVLSRSPRLGEEDLVAIARERGQSHLLAMSGRANLSAAVTDLLVERGNGVVLRTVAGNPTARFSEDGFGTMMRRAVGDEGLATILEQRDDLPAGVMKALVALAAERVRRTMEHATNLPDGIVLDAIAAGAELTERDSSCLVLVSDIDAAMPRIFESAGAGFGEKEVAELLRAGEAADALAGIAYLAGLPAETVGQAWAAPHYDPLLFLARGLRFGWPTFKLMLEARSGRAPPSSLLRDAFANFEALTVQTAQRAMRFVVARGRIGPN